MLFRPGVGRVFPSRNYASSRVEFELEHAVMNWYKMVAPPKLMEEAVNSCSRSHHASIYGHPELYVPRSNDKVNRRHTKSEAW